EWGKRLRRSAAVVVIADTKALIPGEGRAVSVGRLAQIPAKRYAKTNKSRKVRLFPQVYRSGHGAAPAEGSDVSGLETAIRSALARSERANAEVRARIYQSARNALEAGLRKQEINDPEAISAQRHRLQATIHQIEGEERAQLAAAAAREVRVEPVVDARPEPVLRAEPRIDAEPRLEAARPTATAGDIGAIRPERQDGFARSDDAATPKSSASTSQASDFRPERVAKARKRRGRLFSFLLVVRS